MNVNFNIPPLNGNPVEFSRMYFSCDVFERTLLVKCERVLDEALVSVKLSDFTV